jgi:amidase
MVFDSACGAVRRLRAGEISAREGLNEQLRLLHACHERTRAVAWFEDDLVEREAERLDTLFFRNRGEIGPLHGLGITVKDWIDVEGFPCAGATGHHDSPVRRPTVDATAVHRLRRAGAVVIAKTKAWGPGDPDEGAVRHPTHDDRMPGGSSTGEAAAIASGGSIIGLGSDSGGSIRLPASWCGVVGFKPTTGLVPTTGHFPRVGDRHDGRTQIGPIARTLEDVRLLLAVIAGSDGLDSHAPPVDLPWHESVTAAALTFAVITGDDGVAAPDDDVLAAVEAAASVLEADGLTRVEWTAPWVSEGLDITRRYWNRADLTGADVDRQLSDWDRFRYRYRRAAATIDVLLTPTTGSAAPVRGEISGDAFAFTVPASLTGSPAVAVPFGTASNGLPLSVQLIGRPWEDPTLLAVAGLLESAAPG